MAFEVATPAHLQKVGTGTDGWNLSSEYIQVANIDMQGLTRNRIGTDANPFTGKYDGDGYTISNLSNSQAVDYVGLFGYASGAEFTNIRLYDVTMTGGYYTGGLVGYASSCTITGCYVSGSVTSTIWYAGGVSGRVDATTITKSWFKGTVHADSNAGGLVAYSSVSNINNCFARASVSANDAGAGSYSGGLVGFQNQGSITNCYAAGTVSGSETNRGAIGIVYAPATTSRVYFDRTLSGFSSGAYASPRTTDEMTFPENFTTTYITWDFETIWTHDPSYTINDGYPHFEGGFRIWVNKSPNPSFLPPLWLDWKVVPTLWVYKEFAWKPITGVWVRKGDEWKSI